LSTAFLFPGQGADLGLVGKEMAEAFPLVRELVVTALEEIGVGWESLWARNGRALERTAILQPVLTAVTLGVDSTLREAGIAPGWVAGHSLGEISAWAAAGGISPRGAIRLAAKRGYLMEEAAREKPGGMLAVRIHSRQSLERALGLGRISGRLEFAAHNAPDEFVLVGEQKALDAVAAAFPSTRLPVAGPWHGSTMGKAAKEWETLVCSVETTQLTAAFLSNRTGTVVDDHESIPGSLVEALTHPVCWAATMTTLSREGVNAFVTVGPGKTLRGLIRRNGLDACRVLSTDRPADLRRTMEELGS